MTGKTRYTVDMDLPLVMLAPWAGEMPHPNRLTVLFGNGLPARTPIAAALTLEPELSAPL